MLLYLILDILHGCFSCFRGLFRKVLDSAYNLKFTLSLFKVSFQMEHKKKLSEGPALIIGAFQKVQRDAIYLSM